MPQSSGKRPERLEQARVKHKARGLTKANSGFLCCRLCACVWVTGACGAQVEYILRRSLKHSTSLCRAGSPECFSNLCCCLYPLTSSCAIQTCSCHRGCLLSQSTSSRRLSWQQKNRLALLGPSLAASATTPSSPSLSATVTHITHPCQLFLTPKQVCPLETSALVARGWGSFSNAGPNLGTTTLFAFPSPHEVRVIKFRHKRERNFWGPE